MTSAPVFRKLLQNLSTSEGECLVLECRVSGIPFPDVIWRREGHVITDSSDFRIFHKGEITTLVISEAYPEDSGVFSCEASNNAGIATTTCKIVVKPSGPGSPSVLTKAPSTNFGKKQPLFSSQRDHKRVCTISSLVTSSVTPLITPPNSGSDCSAQRHVSSCHIFPVKSDQKFARIEETELTSSINCSQKNITSSNNYQSKISTVSRCTRSDQTSNENYNLADQTRRMSNEKTKIVVRPQPTKQECKRRGDYIVYSPALGMNESQPQEYKVSSFEQRLMNEIEYRLERIPPINEDPEDALFEDVPIAQQINPIFVSPLKNFKTGEGSACSFSCRISAKPIAKVFWFKDGKQISKRSKHYLQKTDGKGSYSLHIPRPTMDDDGNYTAVACNPQGRVSTTGRLAVFYEKSSAVRESPMSPTHMVIAASFSSQGALVGDDDCAAEKYYRPSFVQKPPPDTTAEEGKLVRFDVKVSGLPTPNLEWLINGKPVTQDALHKILVRENNTHSFVLERVSPMDEGQYTIKASNRAGFAVIHCQLHVKPRDHIMVPAFIQRLVGQCVAEGDSVRLEARVVGTPYPTICWKKGSDQVYPDKRIHLFEGDNGYLCLQFTQTQLNDAGWYSCNATNAAGISSCNCKLDVYSPLSSAPAERVRIRTPHRYANIAKVAGIDVRESFSPEAYVHSPYLVESEEL